MLILRIFTLIWQLAILVLVYVPCLNAQNSSSGGGIGGAGLSSSPSAISGAAPISNSASPAGNSPGGADFRTAPLPSLSSPRSSTGDAAEAGARRSTSSDLIEDVSRGDGGKNSDSKEKKKGGKEDSDTNRIFSVKTINFQRFVEQTIGYSIPLFGYRLFDTSQYNSLQNVPVPADYVLGPGDEVLVRTWGMLESDIRLMIDRNGQVNVPKVGVFNLAGTKAVDLENTLRTQIGKNFTHFQISATLGQLRSIQIYIVGEAQNPGLHTVSSLSTFISALFETKGPSYWGSLRTIYLKRNGKIISTLDLYPFITYGDTSADKRLLPGDVIVIPPAGQRVALVGATERSAIYELNTARDQLSEYPPLNQQPATIDDLLKWSGGLTNLTSHNKIQLERVDISNSRQPRFTMQRTLDAGTRSMPLRDADIITLFPIGPAFSNAVTLRGNVAAPLRYPYSSGMTLGELIPDKEALLTPDYFLRKNILVQFGSYTRGNLDTVPYQVKNLVDELNWEYAVIERLDTESLTTRLITFNLGAVIRKEGDSRIPLISGDVVTVFSIKDIPIPVSRKNTIVRIEGEVNRPGVYQVKSGQSIQELLALAGGVTPQAYIFGSEFYRESLRQNQQVNLNKTLDRLQSQLLASFDKNIQSLSGSADNGSGAVAIRLSIQQQAVRQQVEALRNLKATGRMNLDLPGGLAKISDMPPISLEDSDRLFIPPRPDFVNVMGSVYSESSHIYRPGKSLLAYVKQAGPTTFADIDETFVLRPDGSVVTFKNNRWSNNSLSDIEILPGDTIVIPEIFDKESTWSVVTRHLKDIAIILQGFGIGAAAIKVLR